MHSQQQYTPLRWSVAIEISRLETVVRVMWRRCWVVDETCTSSSCLLLTLHQDDMGVFAIASVCDFQLFLAMVGFEVVIDRRSEDVGSTWHKVRDGHGYGRGLYSQGIKRRQHYGWQHET